MTPQEANKIIAEFMGLSFTLDGTPFDVEVYINSQGEEEFNQIPLLKFSESLDALVPVWEKLGYSSIDIGHLSQPHMSGNSHRAYIRGLNGKGQGEGTSTQEAATIATAKAIQELGEK